MVKIRATHDAVRERVAQPGIQHEALRGGGGAALVVRRTCTEAASPERTRLGLSSVPSNSTWWSDSS